MGEDERDPGPAAPVAEPAATLGVARGDRVHSFENDAIRVTWSRMRCTHVAACVMNLPTVFEPGRRPWIDLERGSADAVARAVQHCPTSGYSSDVLATCRENQARLRARLDAVIAGLRR